MTQSKTPHLAVRRITPSDRAVVTGILTTAFARCPLLRWLYPEPDRYLRCFAGWLDHYAGDPYLRGNGVVYEGLEGALTWLDPLVPQDVSGLMSYMMRTVPESHCGDVERVFEGFAEHHPSEPCWYFTMLGADPYYQKRGLGEEIYRYGASLTDQAGMLAYGETTSERAAQIYERFGWEVIGEVQSGSSPPYFPMTRKPQNPPLKTAVILTGDEMV
ncbi:acetyltransferase family protein [Burkholderia sp. MSHR3999]|uniref:GNAT family N-acetyltransferase n=1 Tax=Burkholderia sp. MSHR3999 TaxID=1542965 RepID=UPI0005B6D3D6|nr:GNAT family N-acetyltransferase [Burkholderia sp. MSHR3999]KIP17228.1 acetyltransferase family protein [Burkholderia sp. MSHR3999]